MNVELDCLVLGTGQSQNNHLARLKQHRFHLEGYDWVSVIVIVEHLEAANQF